MTLLHSSPMVYTPAFDKGRGSFFSVKVRRMMLRDGVYGMSAKSTDINPNKGVTVLDVTDSVLNKGGVIVDSGTTDTYWNSGISTEFKRVFKEKAGWDFHNNAIAMTDEEFRALPTILMQLVSDDDTNSHIVDFFKTDGLAGAMDTKHPSDVIYAIPPSHYMEYNPQKKTYTCRFYPSERSGSVFGANAMMGHDVFFDIDKKQIGWAESDCDYTTTITEHGYSFEIDGTLKDVEDVNAKTAENTNNNNNNDNSDSEQEAPANCEDIRSGTKCQKIEGCTWGWGKCTPGPGEETPSDSSTDVPTVDGTEVSSIEDSDTSESESLSLSDQVMEHAFEIRVGSAVFVASLVLCFCYCLWCRGSRRNGKYARTALAPTIEMTHGSNTNNDNLGSFQDEPADDDFGSDSKSNASRTSSQFRDDPS